MLRCKEKPESLYREAGIKNLWPVEDELINSWSNVMNYIVANAKEQLIVCMDDDIEKFYYVSNETVQITDPETIVNELERILTIMDDWVLVSEL